MHKQKLKQNGLTYIIPKQNREIPSMVFALLSATGQPIKQITHEKYMNMCLPISYQMKSKLHIYVELILKKEKD